MIEENNPKSLFVFENLCPFKPNSLLILKVLIILFIILIFVFDSQGFKLYISQSSTREAELHRHTPIVFQGIGLCGCGVWLGKSEVHRQDDRLETYKQEQKTQLRSKISSF